MKERPIIFNGAMVRAILDGQKSQTRRIVKPQPPYGCEYSINGNGTHAICHTKGPIDSHTRWVPPKPNSTDHRLPCPYGKPGDRLWVRETWAASSAYDGIAPRNIDPGAGLRYAATDSRLGIKNRPSIHMPRWASRITLEITSVRVERLHDISANDANAEGVQAWVESFNKTGSYHQNGQLQAYPVTAFSRLWESINGARSWASNPWVWVIEFKVIEERVQ